MKLWKFCNIRVFLGLIPLVIFVNIYLYLMFFAKSNVKIIPLSEIPNYLVTVQYNASFLNSSKLQLCDIMVKSDDPVLLTPKESISDQILNFLPSKLNIQPGGIWQPPQCLSQHHIAIIVPYRNREHQLRSFLAYMHPFLQYQQMNYRIFVIEQSNHRDFNRARLFNIGFTEANKASNFLCYIFHDVDLIPQNLNNVYGCTILPRHMSAYIDYFNYKVPYDQIIGGAVAILKDRFVEVNGFSNIFFGWGGEDDDFYNRVTLNGSKICRYSSNVAQYVMLAHEKEKPSDDRYYFLSSGIQRYKTDGLNSLKYTIIKYELLPLYTRIYVDI